MSRRRNPGQKRANKIRAAGAEARVRTLAAKGMSAREISETLRAEGVSVGKTSIAEFIREDTEDRREAARHVAAVDAQASIPIVTSALRETLDVNLDLLRRAHAAAQPHDDEADPADVLAQLHSASGPISRFSSAVVAASRALAAATTGEDDGEKRLRDLHTNIQSALDRKRKRDEGASLH